MTLNVLFDNGKHKIESAGNFTPPITNKIVLASPSGSRQVVAQGGSIDITAEIRDGAGNILPLSDTFAMPVERVGGAIERTISMEFIDGVCNKTIAWPNSGEFRVTAELINMHLPRANHFKFDTFSVSVTE